MMAELETDVKKSSVKRNDTMTRENLIAHLKAVGQRIVDDAERIAPDAENTNLIAIQASIAPCKQVTEVEYYITRYADPRIKRSGEAEV